MWWTHLSLILQGKISEHGENTDRSHDSDVAERMHDIESVKSHHSLRPRAHLPVDSEVADELRSRNIEVGSVPSASVADPLSDHEELCERGASESGREQESMQFAVVENPISCEVQVRYITMGLQSLDEVDLKEVFKKRSMVMKNVPPFLRGCFRGAMRLVCKTVNHGRRESNVQMEDARVEVVSFVASHVGVQASERRVGPAAEVG